MDGAHKTRSARSFHSGCLFKDPTLRQARLPALQGG
jgi:hypothetical protein